MKPTFPLICTVLALLGKSAIARDEPPLLVIPVEAEEKLSESLQLKTLQAEVKCYGNKATAVCVKVGFDPRKGIGLYINFD